MDLHESALGKQVEYKDGYDPSLLMGIPRGNEIVSSQAIYGGDYWTAYELSWLSDAGKPEVAIGSIYVPCDSPNIVESKSMKLYFNGFNNQSFSSWDDVQAIISKDLSSVAGSPVDVQLFHLESSKCMPVTHQDILCIDDVDVVIKTYDCPNSALLKTGDDMVSEVLVSHVFRSNCPVTNQPDWASIYIDYTGSKIHHDGLLSYLVSYRNHQGFHESCVEQIFSDISSAGSFETLTVMGRFTRRGGIDINPVRSLHAAPQLFGRTLRQ